SEPVQDPRLEVELRGERLHDLGSRRAAAGEEELRRDRSVALAARPERARHFLREALDPADRVVLGEVADGRAARERDAPLLDEDDVRRARADEDEQRVLPLGLEEPREARRRL